MAKPIDGDKVEIINDDPRDDLTDAEEATKKPKTDDEALAEWVLSKTEEWKDHRNANYMSKWDMYERLWRCIYSDSEKNREKERSRIVSPALSEAVENGVSEIEEAVFGRGDFFSIRAERTDSAPDREALRRNEEQLKEDLMKLGFTESCAEALINAAVYGTGIAEIIPEEISKYDVKVEVGPIDPKTGQPGAPMLNASTSSVSSHTLRSVNPRNFIIDPAARGIEDGLGCAVEEDVGTHLLVAGIESGEYRKIDLESGAGDTQTQADHQVETPWMQDVTPVVRYYGKVPRDLLFPPQKTADLFPDENEPGASVDESNMVEAKVFIAKNTSGILVAEENIDVQKDRPVVAFTWDRVPGRFWGRGICEKGATPQRMLDAELRSRIDALAFVAAPMMAMDASRLPRGFKLEVYPGKNVLLAGNPTEILKPFKFGELDQNSGPQVEMLDRMVQRATGSIDASQIAQSGVSGEARSGAVSMAMSGIVKRNKRTLTRYLDMFLGPALRKIMWRNMQYDPDRYVPVNFSFNISSTMGIMQREYEAMQLTQMLQSVQQGTSEHLMVLIGLVANSGMSNREEVLASLRMKLAKQIQMENMPPIDPNAQPQDPVTLELERAKAIADLQRQYAEIGKVRAETRKIWAEAYGEELEPGFRQQELALRGIYQTAEDKINEEFNRRMKIAEELRKREELRVKERIADKQLQSSMMPMEQPDVSQYE